jgi:DNA mismatch repair ATPase MutL
LYLVLFTDEAFGAKLLEAITAGLYDGNLNCLREYVQNCIDSEADKANIFFENRQTVLAIEDNGCGMNKRAERSIISW